MRSSPTVCWSRRRAPAPARRFAYLVPALIAGGKVIISTGTKTLQDQLFTKDLPTVRDALKVPVTVALLKGRANYVCLHYLERAKAEGRFASRDDARHLPLIARFARTSQERRQGRVLRRAGERGHLVLGHVDARELPRLRVHALQGLLRHGGAPTGNGGRCRGGEPSSVLRRRHAARRGRDGAAAGLQHGDLRRGAPAAGDREPSSSARASRPRS